MDIFDIYLNNLDAPNVDSIKAYKLKFVKNILGASTPYFISRTDVNYDRRLIDDIFKWVYQVNKDVLEHPAVLHALKTKYEDNNKILRKIDIDNPRYFTDTMSEYINNPHEVEEANMLEVNMSFLATMLTMYKTNKNLWDSDHMVIMFMFLECRSLFKKVSMDVDAASIYYYSFKSAINAYYDHKLADTLTGIALKKIVYEILCCIASDIEEQGCTINSIDVDTILYTGGIDKLEDYSPFIIEKGEPYKSQRK